MARHAPTQGIAVRVDHTIANRRTMNEMVLVVDDEPKIAKLACDYLEQGGFRVATAGNGAAALESVKRARPDLIVLDLRLPDMDGLDVCRAVRRDSDVPIIILTARADEADRLIGLELGADDYVTKPFSIRELMARVKAVLRRVSPPATTPEVYRFSNVEVNIRSNEVRRAGEPVELSAKEFALLVYLVAHPAETLSRDRLLDAVWGYENYPNTRTVDTHILHLRQKLEPNPEEPRLILTVHGSGYKFVG